MEFIVLSAVVLVVIYFAVKLGKKTEVAVVEEVVAPVPTPDVAPQVTPIKAPAKKPTVKKATTRTDKPAVAKKKAPAKK